MLSYETHVLPTGQPQPSISQNSLSTTTIQMDNMRNEAAPIDAPAGPVTSQNTVAKTNGQPAPKHHHIWLVTGPAGCGKSTVAQHLSDALNLPYIEGDEFHPPANVEKMANGQPLNDEDRWDWLTLLRNESLQRLSAGAEGVVLTCSALKRKYRDVIRVAPYYLNDVILHFIYLHAPKAVLAERVGKRQGHYMGANMVESQFKALEAPTAEEKDVISIDVSVSADEVKSTALRLVTQKIQEAA